MSKNNEHIQYAYDQLDLYIKENIMFIFREADLIDLLIDLLIYTS